jgi:predicted protein tyrosine phosphatase
VKELRLVPVGAGALALASRPKLTDLARLREAGVTHLVTLLSEREGAPQLGEAARAEGLLWVWIPFDGGKVPKDSREPELRRALAELRDAIAAGGKLVVHCSAGIHRTGMVGYALLRSLPLDRDAARAKLRELREVTADDVGEDRLAWGDALAG